MIVSSSLRRHLFRVVAAAVLAVALLVSLRPSAEAATYRNHVARVPNTPSNTQTARVWINSDTAFGETAGVETRISGVYAKYLGTFDNTGYAGANWRVDLPAQPAGTFVEYQLFTRSQGGGDYGFTGFNWSYTVNSGDVQWNDLYHNTFEGWYRNPFGAVAAGTEVTLRFHSAPGDVDSVALRVYTYDPATGSTSGPVDYAMSYQQINWYPTPVVGQWSRTLVTPASPAILYYHFVITDGLDVDYYGDDHGGPHDNLNQGGTGAASDNQGAEGFQLTVYANGFQTPDWLQDAVVYQIFPDRFRNGDPSNDYCRSGGTTGCPLFYGDQDVLLRDPWNSLIGDPRQPGPYFNEYGTQFYGGDLQGLVDKLDYLKAAGFDTIYTTPIFDGSSNHRYDTDDYMAIDPALGTLADFNTLITELNARGMHLIVDGVFNHTSSDSVYFDRYGRYPGNDGACESLGSAYRDWFEFLNNDVPCGDGDYTGWFGYSSLAVLEDGEPDVRDYIYRDANSVMETWYDRGVDGWRFDVADEISHNWWRDFRPYAKADAPNGPLVGEVWPDASAFLLGDQLDSVMNYRFRKNVLGFVRQAGFEDNDNNGNNEIISLTPSEFDRAMASVREDYPPEATAAMLNLLDSHDTNRLRYLVDILGESDIETLQRQKLAALFQYTYMGAPMVYYGDEVALDSPSLANHVTNGPEDDPYNRAPYPWADEGGDDDIYGPADADMLAYYTRLAELRRQYPFLSDGNFYTLLTGDTTSWTSADDTTYVFARTGSGEAVFVALNPGNSANTVGVSSGFIDDGSVWEDMLTGNIYNASYSYISLTLPPRSGVFLARAVTSLTVEKTAVGDTTGLSDWQFSVNSNNAYTLPAAGGEFTITNIITGTTTVAETTVSGWAAALSCDNGATGTASATFNLDTGEDVVCTFTNTQDAPPSGDLTVTKVVVGATPGADWAFTGDLGPFNLPAAGGGATYSDQATGNYTINETYVPGWATTTSCTPGSETGGRSVTLTLDEDEAAECTFTNTLCQPGYYDDMSACVPADPGHYVDMPGAIAQSACVPGYYQPAGAAVLCIGAAAGYYVDTTAAIEQTACPLGTTSPPLSDSIDDCVSTTADLTIAKTTDPAGGTGFPFTLDPGAVTFADKWGSNGVGQGDFNGPFGIAVDAAGNVYVADTFAYRVQKFDADGNFIRAWGQDVKVGGVTGFEICLPADTCKAGTVGAGNGAFNLPHGIAVDAAGNVYVSDSSNHRIQKFDTNGTYLDQWGSEGDDGGQFDTPNGVAVDGAGNVYVADSFNNRVQKFAGDGTFLLAWGHDVVDDANSVGFEICTPSDNCWAGIAGTGDGQLDDPFGVAVYGGYVYVADTFNHRVQVFATNGNYLNKWGSEGSGDGQFKYPYGLTVDAAGNVYVADSNAFPGNTNDRIQKFDANGGYLGQWGSEGTNDGEFDMPTGVAASGASIYVTEYEGHRVQRFSQTGATLDDGQSHTFQNLAAGTYLVSELVPAGWALDDIDCGAATVTESGNTVSVTLAAGDDVTCTFSNTEAAPLAADLTITKVVVGDAPGADWAFSGDLGSFTLPAAGGSAPFTGLTPGNFTVSETDLPGWAAAVSCSPGGASGTNSVTLTLAAGDAVECTFTNTLCQPGSYDNGTACVPASPGHYVDVAGAVAEIACAAGKYQPNSGQTSCLDAPAGSYVPAEGAEQATLCAAGTYQPNTGQTSCLDAPAGSYVPAPGAEQATLCAAGTYQPDTGQTSCLDAPAGSYVPAAGAEQATLCAAGTYQPNTGQTSCLDAPAGSYVPAAGAEQATLCAAGTYQPNTGQTSCLDAPAGSYVPAPGAEQATLCAAGTYQPDTGQTACLAAPAGSYVPAAGAEQATLCSPGYYQPNPGQTACIAADPGYYVPDEGATEQTPCAPGYTSGPAATVCTPILDTTPPTVTINQASGQADPTSSSPINFTVVFNEPVSGFATGDVTLSGTAGATTATVSQIAPNDGTTYNVAVTGMTSSGTVIATVGANNAQDAANNGNTASTSTDNTVTYDATAPNTTLIAFPINPTNSTSATFQFTGDDGGGVGGLMFECRIDGGAWTACTSPQTYTGLSDGSHTFQVQARDSVGNTDDSPASYTWLIDTTPPTVTINQASGQADPTGSSPINFTVVLSEPFTGFATGDVTLSGTAGATTATVTPVTTTTYTVAVSGMTNSGTVIATVAANVVQDAAGNGNTASTSTDNQVTYNAPDTTAPTVTINQASGQADPTGSSPINFTVVFNEPVTGFATGDVTLSGTAGATTATVTQIAPNNGTTYTVAVTGMTNSGTVIATVAASVADDAAGNDNTASTSTDNQVTYNAPAAAGAIYVTAAGGRVTGGPLYQKNDILKWNGSAWSVWFDGATRGMAASADIMAFDVDNDAARSAWIVIRQAQQLPGVGKMEPQQIAYYNGATWSRFFDGRDVGLLTTGERINGIEVLPGSVSPIGTGCLYYLLITTTAAGGVPVGSGNVNFTGEDVLGFCMTSMGANTAGQWHVAFEGESQGLQKNNNLGLSANSNASVLYFTVKSNFTGDGGLIRPSQLFSFSGGVFSGPLWKAADHGLTQQVDGIDVVGSIP